MYLDSLFGKGDLFQVVGSADISEHISGRRVFDQLILSNSKGLIFPRASSAGR